MLYVWPSWFLIPFACVMVMQMVCFMWRSPGYDDVVKICVFLPLRLHWFTMCRWMSSSIKTEVYKNIPSHNLKVNTDHPIRQDKDNDSPLPNTTYNHLSCFWREFNHKCHENCNFYLRQINCKLYMKQNNTRTVTYITIWHWAKGQKS